MTALERGICPTCRVPRALRADGSLGAHRQILADGYSRGSECPSVGDAPDCCVGEPSMDGDPNGMHSFDCPTYQAMVDKWIKAQRRPRGPQTRGPQPRRIPLDKLPAYARIERNVDGSILALHPIDPARVTADPEHGRFIIRADPPSDPEETP